MSHVFKGAMFDRYPVPAMDKNTFTLDHQRLFTAEMGYVVPCAFFPINPNDTASMAASAFVRMMPMYAPIMHQLDVSFYAFYMRENQLWKKFDDFIRGGDDGQTEYDKPNIGQELFPSRNRNMMHQFYAALTQKDPENWDPEKDGYAPTLPRSQGQHGFLLGPGSLADHLGLPVVDVGAILESGVDWEEIYGAFIDADMRPWDVAGFKMYQEIYNEYFRDEFISDKVETFKDFDGDFATVKSMTLYELQDLFKLRSRAWEKDQFTSALPEPVAIPEVLIPFAADVELSGSGNVYGSTDFIYQGEFLDDRNTLELPIGSSSGTRYASLDVWSQGDKSGRLITQPAVISGESIANAITAKISNISATINQLRANIALQEFYEQQRGGNRIKEFIMLNYNSVIPDYRLDRPQYLGGFKFTLGISQVLQTSSSVGSGEDLQALGQMAGQGLAGQSGFLFKEHFPEHGYVMVVANVRPRSMYCQGMSNLLQRFNRMDYYYNKLAHIGDEPMKNSELYLDLLQRDNSIADETFGYQTRYWAYKYIPNSVHGDFRTTLKDWHIGRFFDKTPNLNQDFIEIDPDRQGLNRIFNYQGDDYGHFLFQTSFDLKINRVMDVYSTPRFI